MSPVCVKSWRFAARCVVVAVAITLVSGCELSDGSSSGSVAGTDGGSYEGGGAGGSSEPSDPLASPPVSESPDPGGGGGSTPGGGGSGGGTPSPDPDPDPDPQPEPEPDPDPDPQPEPEPDPDPQPEPEPEPDPDPQPETYPVSLEWDAVETNADGSECTDLGGYIVHDGPEPGVYLLENDVGLTTSVTLDGFDPGTYYFAVTAYDTFGNESEYSTELEVVVEAQ